jgi:hypothetical protein
VYDETPALASFMIDIPTISAIVVAAGVLIGLFFTLLELRHLARTRKTDVIMRIYDRFSSKEMVEAISSIGQLKFKLLEPMPSEKLTGVVQVSTLFEGLGVLLERALIDVELVDSLFGPSLDTLWEPIRPFIYSTRESLKQPFMFSHFEYLHNRLNDYRRENTKKG